MDGPPYARIVADIRGRITSGELGPGDRVPSARQITRDWSVAIATATKALAVLRQEGLVRAVPGVGTVVQPRPAPARNPRYGELVPERIVHAAIQVADGEGLAALSMRRLATELGVATMALYRHVRSRDDLVLMMIDKVMADTPLPDVKGNWRVRLEALARLQWSGYQRHPWMATAISMTRPQMARRGMLHTEYALQALDGIGLDLNQQFHAAIGLLGYVRGLAVSLEPEAQARQDTGLTEEEWMDTQVAAFASVFASGQYPMLLKSTRTGIDMDLDSLFEFGLRSLLDGYAVLIRSMKR